MAISFNKVGNPIKFPGVIDRKPIALTYGSNATVTIYEPSTKTVLEVIKTYLDKYKLNDLNKILDNTLELTTLVNDTIITTIKNVDPKLTIEDFTGIQIQASFSDNN